MIDALKVLGLLLAGIALLALALGPGERELADHGTAREIGEQTRRALVRAESQRGRDLPCWTWPGGGRPPTPPRRHPALVAADRLRATDSGWSSIAHRKDG